MFSQDAALAPVGPEIVATIGGLFIPWFMNLIKQQTWGETLRVVIAYVMCAIWTALSFWLTETIVFDGELDYRQLVLMTFVVFTVAHAAFKTYWQQHPSAAYYLNRGNS